MERKIVSVVVECDGRRYRVIDNLRDCLEGVADRVLSEHYIGQKVLDLARVVEVMEVMDVPSDAGTAPRG